MAERNHYSQPMDFEYENKHGTVDPSSPFITGVKQSAGGSFGASQGDLGVNWRLQNEINQRKQNNGQKRAFAQYQSPQKDEQPALRPPGAGQSVLFSQSFGQTPNTNKRLPPRPSERKLDNPWTTPRTNRQVVDASSGGETPDTDNWRADSEATPDTPSMGLSKGIKNMFSLKKRDSNKGKELISKGSPTLGRGDFSKPYSQKAVGRVQKRREKEISKRRRMVKDAADTESETEAGAERNNGDASARRGFDIGGFFHYIETHPNLPHVLSFYAQLALNVFLIFGIMYILYSFWSTIRSDVDKKSHEAMATVLAEIAVCAKHYKDNGCDRGSVVPALENVCREWTQCMEKDPRSVSRARVSAHTFAEIFNSFIEPISWKAMIVSIIIILGSFFVTNMTFSLFRRNTDPYGYNGMPPVPPTPQRHPSWEMNPQYGFTPYNSQYGLPQPQWGQPAGLEPAPSGSQGSQGSPRKSRVLDSPKKPKALEL